MSECVLCNQIGGGQLIAENDHAVAFFDSYPLNPGHALVIPREHTADLFDIDADARAAVWALVDQVHALVKAEFQPDGFNIGLNVLEAAGQTIGHAHVHIIPRNNGDVADPRGGVRWVLPQRAAYWDTQ